MEAKAGGTTIGHSASNEQPTSPCHGTPYYLDCKQQPSSVKDVDRERPSVRYAEVSTTRGRSAPCSTCSLPQTWPRFLRTPLATGATSVCPGTGEPVSSPPTAHTGMFVPPVSSYTKQRTAHGHLMVPTTNGDRLQPNDHLQFPAHDYPHGVPWELSVRRRS